MGRGLSAVVFRQRRGDREAAVKVFRGHWSADAVHMVLGGAPNPYSWCEDAVRCALYRRRILARLVRYWFDDELTVAEAHGVAFNEPQGAWELDTDFVDGAAVALHHPFAAARDSEQLELVSLQHRLQRRLIESGFIGLTWQAGLSNPVAANNFLVSERRRGDRGRGPRWCWIDLESGVPALFPINPVRLLSHYGAWSWRLRRPLFDDVMTARLDRYLADRAAAIDAVHGDGCTRRLRQWAHELDRHQRAWWARGRLRRGIECALVRGRIDRTAAARYRSRPALWLAHEARRLLRAGVMALASRARGALTAITRLRPLAALRAAVHFVGSTDYRRRVARRHALLRVRSWRRRGQLTRREARYLRRRGTRPEHAVYLTDFAVHMALKPVYKGFVWFTLPLLAQAGMVSFTTAAVGLVLGGSIARTLYTAGRCAGELLAGRRPPWLALAVGAAPVVGSAAFPLQLLVSSTSADGSLAAFLLYDSLAALGRKVPIWGGRDTGIEHLFNRVGDRIVRHRAPLMAPLNGSST